MCCQQETTIGNKSLIPLKSLGDNVDVTQSYLTQGVRDLGIYPPIPLGFGGSVLQGRGRLIPWHFPSAPGQREP